MFRAALAAMLASQVEAAAGVEAQPFTLTLGQQNSLHPLAR
jgi:hypothetical protein